MNYGFRGLGSNPNVLPIYYKHKNKREMKVTKVLKIVMSIVRKEHLVFEGKPQYTCSETAITYYKDGTRMIAVPDGGTLYHIPLSLYESIRKQSFIII